jgi:hypothetical protein
MLGRSVHMSYLVVEGDHTREAARRSLHACTGAYNQTSVARAILLANRIPASARFEVCLKLVTEMLMVMYNGLSQLFEAVAGICLPFLIFCVMAGRADPIDQ